MPSDLSAIVSELVKASPPGELTDVKENLLDIVHSENKSVVTNSISNLIETKGIAVNERLIASRYNKDPSSSKYNDFIGKKKFNIDLVTQTAIDIEEFKPDVKYPVYFDRLVEALDIYGEDHYPSQFVYTIIPNPKGGLEIILIGEKLSQVNFYTGRWSSVYSLDKEGNLQGDVSLDIHYYEDGNVRLEFGETTDKVELDEVSADVIVEYIRNTENKATLKMMEDFSLLNQKYFKNLRRLLPITKSKINWGKAIGTYRLGSEVVNTN